MLIFGIVVVGVFFYAKFYDLLTVEAHPNKFTVGMLETPLRVGVPFQVNFSYTVSVP